MITLSLLALLACSGAPPEPPPHSSPVTPTALVHQVIEVDTLAGVYGEAYVLDVRRAEDFKRAHVPGAIHQALGGLDPRDGPVATWDHSRAVYVIDANGEYAGVAARLMASAGFEAYATRGGMEAWLAAGLPVEGELSPR